MKINSKLLEEQFGSVPTFHDSIVEVLKFGSDLTLLMQIYVYEVPTFSDGDEDLHVRAILEFKGLTAFDLPLGDLWVDSMKFHEVDLGVITEFITQEAGALCCITSKTVTVTQSDVVMPRIFP